MTSHIDEHESSTLPQAPSGPPAANPTHLDGAESNRSSDPLQFQPAQFPRRINLGCGFDHRDGYLNVDFQDFHNPDLLADVRDLNVLPSGYYEEIIAQDVLEHLPRTDILATLKEWARLLRPGGKLVLRVPDVIGLAKLLAARQSLAEQEVLLQNLFGTQAYTGDYHHFGFTEFLLRHYLREAGFDCLELTHLDDWLFDVIALRATEPHLEIGDLPFMRLDDAPNILPVGARPSSVDALAVARSYTDPGAADLRSTRFPLIKHLLLRVFRLVTHRQFEHNKAIERAIEALISDNDRLTRTLEQ